MMKPLLILSCALCPPLCAQAPKARSFLFDNYRTVAMLDLEQTRDSGVWDELATSPLKMTIGLIEEQLGINVDKLDRVTMTRGAHAAGGGEEELREVTVLEGSGGFELPGDVSSGRYQREAVGVHALYVERWGGEAFAAPSGRLHVYGPAQLLRDVLEGRPRTGLPSPDVMAFTAGRARALLYFAMDTKRDRAALEELREAAAELMDGFQWPAGDEPTMVGGRVTATGDEDDRHLLLEFVVRHGTAAAGLVATEKAVQDGLASLLKMPEARLFRPILKAVEYERRGTDATWRVDLGRARNVAGSLTTLSPFLFLATALQTEQLPGMKNAPVLEVGVEELVEEPPPPPPEEPSGGGGG